MKLARTAKASNSSRKTVRSCSKARVRTMWMKSSPLCKTTHPPLPWRWQRRKNRVKASKSKSELQSSKQCKLRGRTPSKSLPPNRAFTPMKSSRSLKRSKKIVPKAKHPKWRFPFAAELWPGATCAKPTSLICTTKTAKFRCMCAWTTSAKRALPSSRNGTWAILLRWRALCSAPEPVKFPCTPRLSSSFPRACFPCPKSSTV